MKTRSISYLGAHLSEALRAVQAGEEIVVTDRDRPVAKLVPYVPPARHTDPFDRLVSAGLAKREAGSATRSGACPSRKARRRA